MWAWDTDPTPLPDLSLLEATIQQARLNQKLARGINANTQELKALRVEHGGPSLYRIILGTVAYRFLFKLTPSDDVEAFLGTFEHMALRERWPYDVQANIVAPFLIEEA